jgi:hypothetical protein
VTDEGSVKSTDSIKGIDPKEANTAKIGKPAMAMTQCAKLVKEETNAPGKKPLVLSKFVAFLVVIFAVNGENNQYRIAGKGYPEVALTTTQ